MLRALPSVSVAERGAGGLFFGAVRFAATDFFLAGGFLTVLLSVFIMAMTCAVAFPVGRIRITPIELRHIG
ncbi:MAG: hypothetical protein DWQ09_14240 [Proteobacteria bacterium]|nr:MAG: hypothetical protein DWQ09_14240 [Pseudomonadota bacterium]